MKLKLDDWQEEAMNVKGHMLLCTGRQSGKTFLMARKAGKYMIDHPNSTIIVASLTEDQAKLIIIMTLAYLETDHKKMIAKGDKKPTKKRIWTTNGASMLARPVGDTGNAVRGFTGDILILDEASRMAEVIFEAAKPTLLTTGGKIWICSTPFGTSGYFYESYLNKHKRFTVIHTNAEEVMKARPITDTWTKDRREGSLRLLEEEKKDMTKLQYQQEYLALFVGGIQRFIPDELIDKLCIGSSTYIPIGDKFQGIDIARMGGDETVLISMDRINRENLIQFDLEIPEAQKLTDTARLIIHKDKSINHRKIYMDDGGLGVGVYDILFEDQQTKRKVVALNNAHRSIDIEQGKENPRGKKLLGEDMAINFKILAENGKIKLFDDPRIRQSLRSMQYDNSEGVLKVYGNYAHIFEALKRGVWCMKDKRLKMFIDYI